MRRLDPDKDRDLFIQAWLWESFAPKWFKEADKVFGPPTFEDFIKGSKEDNRATFGVFDNELIGLIILTLKGSGIEVDFMAKPRCDVGKLLIGAMSLRDKVFDDLGVKELYVWTPKKNVPMRRFCATLGFHDTGLRILKGTYRERVIEWQRLSLLRPVENIA